MKPSEELGFLFSGPGTLTAKGCILATQTSGAAMRLVNHVKERDHEGNCLKYTALLKLLGSPEAARRALKDGRKNVTMFRSLCVMGWR